MHVIDNIISKRYFKIKHTMSHRPIQLVFFSEGGEVIKFFIATLTIRLQFNPDFDRGFPRSKSLILVLTNMRMRYVELYYFTKRLGGSGGMTLCV